ncbi:MAG: HEAT repeat domain-containing protein [Planctomycetaceae bacterium]|nr:HEAT repeat domain-containing protein [Planctomycetaceae bacterium]
MLLRSLALAAVGCLIAGRLAVAADATPKLELQPNDKIVILGNTLAERETYFGHLESHLHARFPQHKLVVRNLGWSADTINLRLRSLNFHDHGHTLADEDPDVIFAFFGLNESFEGKKGLEQFKSDLKGFLDDLSRLKYPTRTVDGGLDGKRAGARPDEPAPENPPRIVLFSPIAAEDLDGLHLPQAADLNANIALYAEAMKQLAAEAGVAFIDLFAPSQAMFAASDEPLTINGIHLNDAGYARLAEALDQAMCEGCDAIPAQKYESLRAAVNEKNKQFWYDYRAVNGYYIYGGREEPFGVVNFPAEFEKLRNMTKRRDERVWKVAAGEPVPETIDDSGTGEFVDVKTNVDRPIDLLSPQKSLETFTLAKDFAANVFASEETFPDLRNPCQVAFDAKGRLWVCTMQSYPMYLPGTPPNDKVLILEDTDGDGVADKQTIFAEGLHLPTGIELVPHGAYVAQQPNLMLLKDTDGDDKADARELVLHGFDSADSHHAISAFTWGPGGDLYFQEGTFHHSQIETPYGPTRLANAGVFRYEPLRSKLEVFVSYPFANPWGHTFDKWGQNFVADASGGANYYGTAFSGSVDFPKKHATLKQFLEKQWRPTSGCEIVSSRNFPDEMQGDYLLNNVIGFQGVLQYRMKEVDSGFEATPVDPLLKSTDTNFRPVDFEFGPDGALYICDWYNPLVGHMQHNVRDPNRDNKHGRVYRVHYTKKPLVEPVEIAGATTPELLDLLKTYEDRVRYRVRTELHGRPTDEVVKAVDQWVAALDSKDAEYCHHLLEALWVKQHHEAVDEKLLDKVLTCAEPKARAAATRVVGYWRDRLGDPLAKLQTAVNDEHPRVRLEAVRALSFFDNQQALDVAVESLVHPQDDYLEYTLNETIATLEGRVAKQKASN